MYPYHNRIKQRIANGELIGIEQGNSEFAIVFIFSTYPFTRPNRSGSLWRYSDILNNQSKYIKGVKLCTTKY